MFFEQIRSLLPRGHAWRLPFGSQIRALFEGLASSASDVRDYSDSLWAQLDPQQTSELPTWQNQFGLFPSGTTQNQRDALSSAWRQQGGQDPAYLQACVTAAGFNVTLHEWWQDIAPFSQICCGDTLAECGEPEAECGDRGTTRFVHDPLLYTAQPLIGYTQCGNDTTAPAPFSIAECGEPAAMCNAFLANPDDVRYLVNLDGTQNAPPVIPNDPINAWPYFLYWAGSTLDDTNPSLSTNWATVPAARKEEFERLILKLCPSQYWLVMVVHFT